jgi:dolichol-phosphate mannosyltransferase
MSLGVVIPTLHEAATIGMVVRGVLVALPRAQVLVVDDDSGDDTAGEAARAGAEVLVRQGPRGLGHAYREGLAQARRRGWDAVVQMDGDGSHLASDLPALIDALGAADLVIGSRWVRGGDVSGWSARRRVVSRAASGWARAWLGAGPSDWTSGLRAWRGVALERVLQGARSASGFAWQVEAARSALAAGLSVREVPIRFGPRRAGSSKLSWGVAWEAAWRIPLLR